MKRLLVGLMSLVLLSVSVNAEVFTKDRHEINYTLTAEKAVDFKLEFSSKVDKAYIPCEVRVSVTDVNNKNKVIMNGTFNMKKGLETLHAPVKSGKYNLKLDYYAGDGCWNKPFDLQLTRVSGNFEQEDNDEMQLSLQMKELSYYYGYMQRHHNSSGERKDDIDFYKVVLPDDGQLTVVFSHKDYKKAYQNVRIRLLDATGKVLEDYDSYLNTEGERKSFSLKKGNYFIEIKNEISDGNIQHMAYKIAYRFSKN